MTLQKDMEIHYPIGIEIAIDRFPHAGTHATHRVVGYRYDGYLRIRPLGVSDDAKYAPNPLGKGRILIETHIPIADVITF